MKLDKELFDRVAANARIRLTEKEREEFLPQLGEILEAFSKIDEVDVAKTKPSFQPIELKNVWREDRAGKCLIQEDALKNASHKKDGYFKGPKAL